MGIVEIIAIVAIVFVGSVIQGTVGFGLGLVSVPVMALIDPELVPVVPIGLAVPLVIAITIESRSEVSLRELRWAWIGRIPGTVVGAWLVSALSGATLEATFALLIILAVLLAVRRHKLEPTPAALTGAGFASGVMATAVSTGGPPMVLVLIDETPARLRAQLSAFFLAGSVLSLVALGVAGRTTVDQFVTILWLLPALFAGLVVANRYGTRLPAGAVRSTALVLASISAVVLLAGAVL